MNETLKRQFKEKFESLAGVVRLAENAEEAIRAAMAILDELGAKSVSRSQLPETLARALDHQCREKGVSVLKPPFAASDLPHSIDQTDVGVSMARFAIAEAGALVEVAINDVDRLVSTLPESHIAILPVAEIVETLPEAAPRMREAWSATDKECVVTFISGPSRSGDIEMKLTLGVHGPKRAYAIIVDHLEI